MSNKITDIEEVYTATFDARSKWRNILFALEVSTATINSVGVAGKSDPDTCYREGLSEWFKGGPRTWSDIAAALSTPTVGHEDIAKMIEQDHPVQTIDDDVVPSDTSPTEKSSETGSDNESEKLEDEVIEKEPSVAEVQLRPPLTLKWRKGKKQTPNKMSGPLQIVLIEGNIYVGGGFTGIFNDRDDCTVMKIDIQRDQCSKLPEYKAKWFGLTSLDGQLVAVGGCDIKERKPTNEIAVFESGHWTSPFPKMQIARQTPTAVTFNNRIIVAGGRDDKDQRISSVEVLDVASKKWYFAQPLPIPRSQMKSVVVNNVLHLFGGVDHNGSPVKSVHYVNLDELIERPTVSNEDTPSIWGVLRNTPLDYSTPLKFGKSLLTVGGRDGINAKSRIYLYMPDSKKWVYAGELPTARYSGSAMALPNGEVILVGGQNSTSTSTYISTLDFFSITKSY